MTGARQRQRENVARLRRFYVVSIRHSDVSVAKVM